VVLPTPTISLSATNAVEAVACLLHSVGKSEGDDATRHGDNHRTSNIVSIIHPPLVPCPYPNAHKLSRGTNTKLICLMAIVFIAAIGLASPISSAAIAKLNADDADPTIHRRLPDYDSKKSMDILSRLL
jgi:hypothetical protein